MNQQMNTILFSALCACFGLQSSSAAAAVLIREAYAEPENAPRSLSHTPTVFSFSAWQLQVVCYGPHALENARKIRAFLYLDGSGYPRSILRKAGIWPVPDPPEPRLLHEPEGSLWRQRADLTVSLRKEETQAHENRRGAITVPPAVRVIPR